ncbi:MAG: UV DNA damage endonuclease [Promethearchaeota archaeon]|nr:MAG: UV DNA damage endonuclease [Candidatus Lokiarchaeota archaeon]
MDFNWQNYFNKELKKIGDFIKENKMRITMHPGQYTVLNSNKENVYRRSIEDLRYHTELLDLMQLNSTAKVQIHVGGVYGQKKKSLQRFIARYKELDEHIRERLIIENDERSYNLEDCLTINKSTEIPIVFDIYHHEIYNNGKNLREAFKDVRKTWKKKDGLPILHYSSQRVEGSFGNHALQIKEDHFKSFLEEMRGFNYDIMLEIKDKEKSALRALAIAKRLELKNLNI